VSGRWPLRGAGFAGWAIGEILVNLVTQIDVFSPVSGYALGSSATLF
jgi:hypothetical protein